LGLLALGGLAAVTPVLYLVSIDPVAVHFGVLRFHSMREYGQSGLVSDLPQKFQALLAVLSIIRPALLGGSLQMLPQLMLAVVAVASPLTPRNSFVSYAWMAVFFASLLPTPVHPQYFALLIPLLIIDVVELVAKGSVGKSGALASAAAAYGLIGVAEARHYAVTGEGVPGVVSLDRVSDWSITTVRAASRLIDEKSRTAGRRELVAGLLRRDENRDPP
jgi:hypothetical protein